ncbi:MAG: DUF1269 domain-containing protein [Cyanobacteria bacterium P01_H01_bin.119]
MATLTVWKFDEPELANKAVQKLESLQKQQIIQVYDAATVSWPQGRSKPKTTQAVNLVGAGAFSGGFWGLLLGLIFFTPLLGLAVGAAAGAISGYFRDYGINDDFIKDIREKITEGNSALFLLTGQVTAVDKVKAAFEGEIEHAELLQSNLSGEQEAKLREDFGIEDAAEQAAV